MTTLQVAQCDRAAARYAVEHWYYSRRLPSGTLWLRGVWEDQSYRGCVIFSRGANRHMGSPYGLDVTQLAELTRVALRSHVHPVTQILAAAIRDLHRGSPGLRLLVSHADPAQGHHGGIYQAGGWTYVGDTTPQAEFVIGGVQLHKRTVSGRGWRASLTWLREHVDPNAELVIPPVKHVYLYPLDRAMRRQIRPLAQTPPQSYPDCAA